MGKRMRASFIALLLALCFALPTNAAVLPGYTSKVDYDNTDPARYSILIDLTNQILSVYERDGTGGYSRLVLEGLCTTGGKETPTGTGTYRLGDLKERFGYFVAFGQYAQYWTQVVRGVYIHSVMYDTKSLASMSKSAYRNLGKAVSHGCVRVLPEVAQWIFYNCPPGTICRITTSMPNDSARVSRLKNAMPAYADYVQPADAKAAPPFLPATVRYDNTPLRTGFSGSRDTTVRRLKAGDAVDLLQLGADWVKARTRDGKLGYIQTKYLLLEPDAAAETVTEFYASGKTYVYASMSTGAPRLAAIPKGAVAQVSANPKTGWYEGSFDGVTGYLRTKYVKSRTSLVYPTLPKATAPTQPLPTAALVKYSLRANLRDAPGSSAGVVAVLPAGTPVTLLSLADGWYCADANGLIGYLHSSCVELPG